MGGTSDSRSNATKIALVSGATVAEGVAAATKALGLPEEMIRLRVVGKHRTGLFGLGDVVIDFEATSAEDEVHDAADVLLGEPSKSDQALAVASNTVMVSADTVAEAAVAASKALGASEDRIVLRVVGKHRSGLFGLGDLVIDFEASVSPTGLLVEASVSPTGLPDAPRATLTESTVPLPAVAAVPAPALSIVFREGRVSLTASRPNNSQRRATVVDVDKILTGMPLGARDSEGVADALMRQTGRPVVVGTISATTPPDPSDPIGVYVTKDGLTAWAIPWRDGPLTAEVFDQIINRAGINYGVDQEVRRALLADGLELPVVIARGSQPIPGIDAVVDFRIPKPGTVKDLGGDDQNVDSRKVDHKEVDTGSISAQVGDVLAIKRPMSNATDGVGVSGESIPGVASKDFDLSNAAGKGAWCPKMGFGSRPRYSDPLHGQATGLLWRR